MKKLPIIGFYGYWVILTYLGVVSAAVGIYFAISGNVKGAVICLMASGICDMFDGPVARLAKRTDREKNFGIQIDSLADIIAFGVLPAIIGYTVFINQTNRNSGDFANIVTVVIMILYVLTALIRLAYFNVIETELQNKNEKRKYYEGLPVTTVAIIIPIVYAICVFFDFPLSQVYNKLLLLTSITFVAKVKIPKVRLRYMAGFCLIGLIVVIYIVLSNGALL